MRTRSREEGLSAVAMLGRGKLQDWRHTVIPWYIMVLGLRSSALDQLVLELVRNRLTCIDGSRFASPPTSNRPTWPISRRFRLRPGDRPRTTVCPPARKGTVVHQCVENPFIGRVRG